MECVVQGEPEVWRLVSSGPPSLHLKAELLRKQISPGDDRWASGRGWRVGKVSGLYSFGVKEVSV